jgi:Zn-dependent protease with chaperone function
MRIAAVTAVLVAACILPVLVGPHLRATAPPAWLISFGVASLVAIAAGTVGVLAALVDPGVLPASTLPRLVDRCLGAAREILSHPVQHWPRIVSAVLIALVLGRFLSSLAVTVYRMHRLAVDTSRIGGRKAPDLVEVRTQAAVAMTVGVFRRRIVVSSSLRSLLTPLERTAVIAHERAHVRGRHSMILLLAQSLVHAFGRIAPVREAANCIVVSLELAADDAAVIEVGDPFVVASALERMASPSDLTVGRALAAADTEVAARARRLCGGGVQRRVQDRSLRLVGFAIAAAIFLVSLAVTSPPAGAANSAIRDSAEHEVCHLPH